MATKDLPIQFDCQSKNISVFYEKLIDRANEVGQKIGASDILTIPDSNRVDRFLLTKYGRLIEEDIQNYANIYLSV